MSYPTRRKHPTYDAPQQVAKVPARCHPGRWIKVGQNGALTGKVLQVAALTAVVQGPPRYEVRWFVHLGGGRSVKVEEVERAATAAEIAKAQMNGGAR